MAIWWDDLEILTALDRREGEGRAYGMTGEDFLQAVAAGRRVEDQDRLAFTRMIHMLRQEIPQRLTFVEQNLMGARQPQPHEHAYLQFIWHFELTSAGRDRARGRVVLEALPDPDEDYGRAIPALVLGEFARIIAAYYSAPQLARFVYDAGLSDDPFAQPSYSEDEKERYLSLLLSAIERGVPELRRKLRSFLARFLNGALSIAPDLDQHQQLTNALARAGWRVEGDTLVIREPQRVPVTSAAGTSASALDEMHPLISQAAKDLWNDGHRREAVGRAAVALLDAVRAQSGLDADGQDLMARAFAPDAPRIVVGDLRTENGRNLQRGTHFVAMGAVAAIRNPVSHTLAEHDEDQAREQLAVLSFIARRLDDANNGPPAWRGSS